MKKKIDFDLPVENKGAGITAECRLSWDCNDETAQFLRGKKIDEVYILVAKELFALGYKNLSFSFRVFFDQLYDEFTMLNILIFLQKKYGKNYNVGLQRVYLGKLLRNAKKRAEKNKK